MRSIDDRLVSDLFSDLAREIGALVRQELALVKGEMSANAARVGQDVALLALGGAVLYGGFLALIATLIVGLALAIGSVLAAAAIVTIIVLAGGYYLVRRGLDNLKRVDLAPRQTIESLTINVNWAKEQFR